MNFDTLLMTYDTKNITHFYFYATRHVVMWYTTFFLHPIVIFLRHILANMHIYVLKMLRAIVIQID